LTGLATEQLQAEYDELQQKIAFLKDLLANRAKRMQVVKDELLEVKAKYAEPRRTQILPSEKELNIEDLIERGVCVITVSASGYIKRVPLDTYRTQNRGGVGVIGMQTKDEDYVEHLLTACTHDYVLFFSNRGRMHWLKAYEIPEGQRVGRGKALVNLIQCDEGELVRAMITVGRVDDPERHVIMATANGIIKKTRLDQFQHLRRKGIIAIALEEGDDLIEAKLTDGSRQILLSSESGMACRFREGDCRAMGRDAHGVRGMEVRDADGKITNHVVSMTVVDPEAELLVVTAKGMGKRTRLGTGIAEQDKHIIGGYRLTRRGGKGVISIRLKDDDQVVAALQVAPGDELLISSVKGQLVRISVDDIRAIGRNSQGVRIMRLREDDRISSVSRILELDLAEPAADAEPAENGTAANPAAAARPPRTLPENDAAADEDETDDTPESP